MSATVAVRNGSVYLSASVVETYFRGIEAVIVLIRDGAVSILPVYQMAAGGCLLKMRNALLALTLKLLLHQALPLRLLATARKHVCAGLFELFARGRESFLQLGRSLKGAC